MFAQRYNTGTFHIFNVGSYSLLSILIESIRSVCGGGKVDVLQNVKSTVEKIYFLNVISGDGFCECTSKIW